MVAVDEREVEAFAFGEEPREHDLGPPGVELDELAYTRVLEAAEARVDVAVRQVRVDRDVPGPDPVPEQAFADEERRDRVTETGLERPPRAVSPDAAAQSGSLVGPDRHRRELVQWQALAHPP
jgi:hypothetical protein